MPIKLLVVISLLLSGCTSTTRPVEQWVEFCCENLPAESFSVTTRDIPAFLGPLMISNFMVAFANHGLQPVDQGGDLTVTLSFKQEDLAPDTEMPAAAERIATGDAQRFIAGVNVLITHRASNRRVFEGTVQRLHTVGPGDWMHTGDASIAILAAFTRLLKPFPVNALQTQGEASD